MSVRFCASTTLAMMALAACGPGADDTTAETPLRFDNPQALTSCAAPPEGLAAELFVTGNRNPCPLTVDVAAGTTSGSCEVAPGRVRVLTLDWFADVVDGNDHVIRVLLAQARTEVDLTGDVEAEVSVTIDPDDVVTEGCLDVVADPAGAETTAYDGAEVPPCDLDRSCDDGGACSNLEELCAGDDPFTR